MNNLSKLLIACTSIGLAGIALAAFNPNDDRPSSDKDKKCHITGREWMRHAYDRARDVVNIDNTKDWYRNAEDTFKGAHCNLAPNKGTTRCNDIEKNMADAERRLSQERSAHAEASKQMTLQENAYNGCGNKNDLIHDSRF